MQFESEGLDAGQLIAEAKRGDQDALVQLLFSCHDDIYVFARSQIRSHMNAVFDTGAVLGELWLISSRAIKSFHGTDFAVFKRWLKTICHRRIIDAIRHHNTEKNGGKISHQSISEHKYIELARSLGAEYQTASWNAIQSELATTIKIAISLLCLEQREVIRLHCFDGFTLQEAADEMNKTFDSVRGLLQRARENLKKRLNRSSRWLLS